MTLPRPISMAGRAGRLEWAAQAFAAPFCCVGVFAAISSAPVVAQILGGVLIIFAASWLMWSVTFRRLHDLGKPASEAFKLMVPFANIGFFVALVFQPGAPGDNKFGPPTSLFGLRRLRSAG